MGDLKHIDAVLDTTYELLKKGKKELYFRDMLKTALGDQGIPAYSMAQAMVELHTEVNMDNRFAYRGKGNWGLAEWILPPRSVRAVEEKISVLPGEEVQVRKDRLREIQQPDDRAEGYSDDYADENEVALVK